MFSIVRALPLARLSADQFIFHCSYNVAFYYRKRVCTFKEMDNPRICRCPFDLQAFQFGKQQGDKWS